jgi:hypothetical protein
VLWYFLTHIQTAVPHTLKLCIFYSVFHNIFPCFATWKWRLLSFRMWCHVLKWIVTNTSEERAFSITLLFWRGGLQFSVLYCWLSVRVHFITHQKTVKIITTSMSAPFNVYMQAVSCGVEHSSVCKKVVHYCVLFDTLREEHMWKEKYRSL